MKTTFKLAKGDRVRIKNLPPYMSHFPGEGCMATAEYCSDYAPIGWSLLIDGHGSVSWYPESVLEVISQAIA